MRILIMALVGLSLLLPGYALAEEELAPGSDQCLENATSTAETRECLNSAYEYWDKKLNANYKKAMKSCDDANDPKACKADLKKAQLAWIKYKEAMYPVLYALNGDGTITGIIVDTFAARETKKQAQLLDTE